MVRERQVTPEVASFLRSAVDEKAQSRMIEGSEGARLRHIGDLREELGGMPIEEVEEFAEHALLGMASEKYPWQVRARKTMLLLLPTVMTATAKGGERISADKWFKFYTGAVRTMPGQYTDRSLPDLIEAGCILAPVILRRPDGNVNRAREKGVADAWAAALRKFPTQDNALKTRAKNDILGGVTRIKVAAENELPKETEKAPEPTRARPLRTPDAPVQAEDKKDTAAAPDTNPETPAQEPEGETRPGRRRKVTEKTTSKRAEETTVFQRPSMDEQATNEFTVDPDGSLDKAGAPLPALELRILYVLGTAEGPLDTADFYQGVTGKSKLPAYARDEIDGALVRLRRKLAALTTPAGKKSTFDDYARHIPLPNIDDPTYRLDTPVSLPIESGHPILTPEGYVTPKKPRRK